MAEKTTLSDILQIYSKTYLFSIFSSDDRKSESQKCFSNILYTNMLLTFVILDVYALKLNVEPDWSIVYFFSGIYWRAYTICICLLMLEYRLRSSLILITILEAFQEVDLSLFNFECILNYGKFKTRINIWVKIFWIISLLLLFEDVCYIWIDTEDYDSPFLYFVGCWLFYYFLMWHTLDLFFLSVVLDIKAYQASRMRSLDLQHMKTFKFARMRLTWFASLKKLFSISGFSILVNAVATFSTIVFALFEKSQGSPSQTVAMFAPYSTSSVLTLLWLRTAGDNIQYQVRNL